MSGWIVAVKIPKRLAYATAVPKVKPHHDYGRIERVEEHRIGVLIKNVEIRDLRFRWTRTWRPNRPASMVAVVLSHSGQTSSIDHGSHLPNDCGSPAAAHGC
jgi:hypothetical protein